MNPDGCVFVLGWLGLAVLGGIMVASGHSTAATIGAVILFVTVVLPGLFILNAKMAHLNNQAAQRARQETGRRNAEEYNRRAKEAAEAEARRAPGREQLKQAALRGALDDFAGKAGVLEPPKD